MNIWIEFVMVLLSIYAIIDLVEDYFKHKGKELPKKTKLVLIWLVVLSIGIPYYFYSESRGFDDENQYYVNMFPEENSQKNYRVPAFISIEEDGILISSVDWSNGGETTFYGLNNPPLEPYKKVPLEDDDGEKWYVELTNEQVK